MNLLQSRGRRWLIRRWFTILIPAKDEGERIGGCIRSALAQDYPDFEVIAIDDRSTDQTGKVMDELAGGNPRLRVIHIKEGSLPKGCWKIVRTAHGGARSPRQMVLLCRFGCGASAGCRSATIAVANTNGLIWSAFCPDLRAVLSGNRCSCLWRSGTSAMYLLPFTNYNESKIAFANGQYLCIRRSVYEAIGGHEAVGGMFPKMCRSLVG